MKHTKSCIRLFFAAFLFAGAFGKVVAQSIPEIEFVTVNDPGNPHDPLTGDKYGAVNYRYRIGKYEITNQEYAQFLNSVDPLGGNLKNLYDTQMGSDRGGIDFDSASPLGEKYEAQLGKEDYPVNYVYAYSAIRFINWLNGGDTESGAYLLTGLQSPGLRTLTRQPEAKYWMPTVNEWYKAAYYRGPDSDILPVYGTNYSLYPMGGFAINRNSPPGDENSANYGGQGTPNPRPRPVGSYINAASYYGTFDQGGNLGEWYEGSFEKTLGGGFLNSGEEELDSIAPTSNFLSNAGPTWTVGFRIAALPEFPDSDGDGIEDPYETNTGEFVSKENTGTNPNNPDSDGDGLTDGIEINLYGTNPNQMDSDLDGFNDKSEITAGKDPLDINDTPDAVAIIAIAVEFTFFSELGSNYQVDWSADLESWTTFPEIITGDGNSITRFYSTKEQPKRYFRATKLAEGP